MTNRERVLNSVNRVPHGMDINVPWEPIELKRFWAMARTAGMSKDAVHSLIGKMFEGKEKLHDLTREEFVRLMGDIAVKVMGSRLRGNDNSGMDGYFAGTPMAWSWKKIRWLQRQLGWSDVRLINYIKWHGKETVRKIDHVGWLTVDKARGIITGMEKIRHGNYYRIKKEARI